MAGVESSICFLIGKPLTSYIKRKKALGESLWWLDTVAD